MKNKLQTLVVDLLNSENSRDINIIKMKILEIVEPYKTDKTDNFLEYWQSSVDFRAANLNLEVPGNYQDIYSIIDFYKNQ